MAVSRPDLSWLRVALLSLLAAAAFIAAAIWLLDLIPPKRLTLAAGRPGGAYFELAERYRAILARDGITVEILETAGSVANAEALARPAEPADAAFVQGGVPVPEAAEVEALAAVFLEPLWVLHAGALPEAADMARWPELVIAAGEPGSGTRFVVERMARTLSLAVDPEALVPLGGAEAAAALLAGEVDVALFVAPVDAPYLQPLLADPEVAVSQIRDREAIARRLDFVELADIPPAAFDYAARLPPRRLELVAMTGRLVARSDLHPALVDRLVMAARRAHSPSDLISAEGRFPSVRGAAMPVNDQAAALLSRPPSRLHDLLPYWMVAQINSFAILLVPVLFLLVPLFRMVPSIYQWQMRARVWRRYVDLRRIDRAALASADPAELDRLTGRLDRIEAEIAGLRLPLRFREYAYTMRVHIDLLRRRIAERRRALVGDPG